MEIREATEEDNIVYAETPALEDDTDEVLSPSDLTNVEKHVIPKYPHPYFRGARGGVYIRKKDKDGDPVEAWLDISFEMYDSLHEVTMPIH